MCLISIYFYMKFLSHQLGKLQFKINYFLIIFNLFPEKLKWINNLLQKMTPIEKKHNWILQKSPISFDLIKRYCFWLSHLTHDNSYVQAVTNLFIFSDIWPFSICVYLFPLHRSIFRLQIVMKNYYNWLEFVKTASLGE